MNTKSRISDDSLEEDAHDLIGAARDALWAARNKAKHIKDEHRRMKLMRDIEEFEA